MGARPVLPPEPPHSRAGAAAAASEAAADATLADASAALRAEVERIVARHQLELQRCIASWARRQQDLLHTGPGGAAGPPRSRPTSGRAVWGSRASSPLGRAAANGTSSTAPPEPVDHEKVSFVEPFGAEVSATDTLPQISFVEPFGAEEVSEVAHPGVVLPPSPDEAAETPSPAYRVQKWASDLMPDGLKSIVPSSGGGHFQPMSAAQLAAERDRRMAATSDAPGPILPRAGTTQFSDGAKAMARKKMRKKAQSKRAGDFLIKSKRDEVFMRQNRLQKITHSRYYEWFSGFLIISNAVLMGLDTQFTATRAAKNAELGLPQDRTDPWAFDILQLIYTAVFAVELLLRWVSEGVTAFLLNQERSWNIFDIVVVSASVIDGFILSWVTAHNTGVSLPNASLLRVLRVVRIVRVARVIRIMRFFKELRMMIFAILGSLKSLVWVVITLLLVVFIFGISITSGVIDFLAESEMWLEDDYQELVMLFGRLDSSMLYLYMSISNGQDWATMYQALCPLPWTYRALFLLFISFATWAVTNIVTGIFVDSAMQCNTADRDIIVQEELAEKDEYLRNMELVFIEMDDDGTGNISMQEFETKLNDERVIAYFNALKLDASDARKLFRLLDYDESGEIDIDEFMAGCHKLKGESRALDLAIMQLEVKWLSEAVLALHMAVERGFETLRG